MTRIIHILVCLAVIWPASLSALEIRIRARATIEVDVSAAGTVAQVSGALRDDLNRGLPQRAVFVQIDSVKSAQTVVSSTVHTDQRGRFGVQEELPPGDYEVFVRFDETEHLDGIAKSDRLRLEPKPVDVRAFAPGFVYQRENPAWLSARSSAGDVPYQGWAQVIVNDAEVGRMELDAGGRGTFDIAPHLQGGTNDVVVRTPGSAYRDEAQARVEVRFSDEVTIDATIDERLERLQRGLAVSGTIVDGDGPLEGLRVRAQIVPEVLFDEDAEMKGLIATAVTDREGKFVAFIPATKLADGTYRGTAEFLPPVGESVSVDAGSAEVDTRAFRWAVNGFGLTAILLGFLVLVARGGQVFWQRLREFRRRRERAQRQQRAMEEVETIVPVYLDPTDAGSTVQVARNDIGGLAWDVWQEEPVGGVEVELRAEGRETLKTTAGPGGKFRFPDVPDGEWSLVATKFGFIRGQLRIETPHDGRMSYFRLDLVAVPLKIRRLYGAVLEQSIGEDLWGKLSPREIETRLGSLWSTVDADKATDRAALRRVVLQRLKSYEGEAGLDVALAALTEAVEEAYFSGRTYGEDAFLFARALALELHRSAERREQG